ncbi:MAG: hypothetical protein M3Q95_11930 [Bacteroidota bacterium]|nr:hypothetical protein [Bacteroidota bacterium]
MKSKICVTLLLACFLFSGCKLVLRKIYGLKKADIKTHEAISEFHNDIGFQDIPYYGIKAQIWKEPRTFSIPDVLVFNKEGKYIPFKDSLKPNCNGPAEVFLSELHAAKPYNFSDQFTLDSFLMLMEDPECNPIEKVAMNEKDFYIFMTTASFAGKKIFKEKSAIWLDSLKNNKNISYELYLINADWKSCWSESDKKYFTSDE